jgi:CHASE2 domain-containing sensor protein
MTLPTFLLALLFALLYGAIYHLIRGRRFWRLFLYFGLSILGFGIGHLVGVWRGWIFIPLGSMNLGLSSIGSILILLLGDWLSRIETKERSKV